MTRKSPSGETGAIPKSIAADQPNHTVDGRQNAWDHADDWWKSCAEMALKVLADTGRPFTVDQVALLVPKPDHPCRFGALFATAARREQIALVGAQISAEDGRPLRVWQGVQK